MATISKSVLRRFVLGKQGLWPGRRWEGKTGTAEALKNIEAIQIDPVSVVAQSHDIVLRGRVHAYIPEYLQSLLYEERRFFDYGGALMIYPMDELPYWRVIMERYKAEARWADFAAANPKLLNEVRQTIRDQGPLRSRDLKGKRVSNYRGSKDTNVALYYLWLTGELMTHHRQGKERVYDLLTNIAPAHLQYTANESDTIAYITRKDISQLGIVDLRAFRGIWKALSGSPVKLDEARSTIAEWIDQEKLAQIQVEGYGQPYFILASDMSLLLALQEGTVPPAWQPKKTTTSQEVIFLSPLEYVSARGRAAKLFDFAYIWEIYKPAVPRQYGPYTMPILFGDRLVARLDSKYDRQNQILAINGFWPETWFNPDTDFANALAKGLSEFMNFLGANAIDATNLKPAFLRKKVKQLTV
jgi:uncharacterized protein YcaQ